MSSSSSSAANLPAPLPATGDLFTIRGNVPEYGEKTFTCVSVKNFRVNLAGVRASRHLHRSRITLRLRWEPTLRNYWVQTNKRAYMLVRQGQAQHEALKPVDVELPDETFNPVFDARHYCKVGDVLQEQNTWGRDYGREGIVTKVTRCFVTYEISEDGRETKTYRGKVKYVARPRGESYIRVGGRGDYIWMEKQV